MKSLKQLYRIGKGPSSSHTMGPYSAAVRFKEANPEAERFTVILYGSLAKTGRGHMTDEALKEAFGSIPCEIIFDTESETPTHPNTLDIIASVGGREVAKERFFSVGGGAVIAEGETLAEAEEVYEMESFTEISEYCRAKDLRLCRLGVAEILQRLSQDFLWSATFD